MGKAKRINDRHATEVMSAPAVAAKTNKWLTPVIAAVIALVVVACLILAAVQSSGAILRSKKPFQTAHVTITGSMFQYQYMSYYNYYLSQVDESMQQYLQYLQSYYLSSAMSAAASECELFAVYGEAAHREGLKLDDDDKAELETYMNNLENTAAYYGYNNLSAYLAAAFGEGVKEKDVKAMYELNLLCTKYEEQLAEKTKSALTDDEIVKYYEDNADDFITASYLGYSFKVTKTTVNSADYKTTEEYNAAVEAANNQFALDKADADAKAAALTLAVSAADFTAMLAADGLTPTEGNDVIKANLSQDTVIEWIFTQKAAVNATKSFGAGSDSEYSAVAYIITKSASRDESLTKNVAYVVSTNDKLPLADAKAFAEELKSSATGVTKETMVTLATVHGWADYMQYVENAPADAFNLETVTNWLSSDEAVAGSVFTTEETYNSTTYTGVLLVDSIGAPAWKVDAKSACLTAKMEEWLTAAKTEYDLKTNLDYWMAENAE